MLFSSPSQHVQNKQPRVTRSAGDVQAAVRTGGPAHVLLCLQVTTTFLHKLCLLQNFFRLQGLVSISRTLGKSRYPYSTGSRAGAFLDPTRWGPEPSWSLLGPFLGPEPSWTPRADPTPCFTSWSPSTFSLLGQDGLVSGPSVGTCHSDPSLSSKHTHQASEMLRRRELPWEKQSCAGGDSPETAPAHNSRTLGPPRRFRLVCTQQRKD